MYEHFNPMAEFDQIVSDSEALTVILVLFICAIAAAAFGSYLIAFICIGLLYVVDAEVVSQLPDRRAEIDLLYPIPDELF